MAGISGWIFMAIGAIVALFSRYIQKKGGDGLGLFFWAGVVMIGIGVFKIAARFMLREKKAEQEKENQEKGQFKFGFNKDLEAVDSNELLREKAKAVKSMEEMNILVCPNCGTKHYSNSNYCHMCGRKLR
jgi:hypothetical protein